MSKTQIPTAKRPHLHPAILVAFGLLAFLLPAQSADRAAKTPMIRIVCPPSFGEETDYVLASKDKKDQWRKREKLDLRPSYLSDWIKAPAGELAVCVVEDRKLVSKWTFTFAEGTRRALIILLPNENDQGETALVIDSDKVSFSKGEILLINASSQPCAVSLGGDEVESKPGEKLVTKPTVDDKGMYQMLVKYTDKDGKTETCHDRFLSSNQASRELLLLVPSPNHVVQVLTVSDFGPFE